MTGAVPEIRRIPVAAITVLNPRSRNKRVFQELVKSIANLGLKKPITVSARQDGGYDLICGQGRLEAYVALGQGEIPAIITEASEEDSPAFRAGHFLHFGHGRQACAGRVIPLRSIRPGPCYPGLADGQGFRRAFRVPATLAQRRQT